MVLSADWVTPTEVKGASSGILVTNISTEISAINMALNYINSKTSHLPTQPRHILLANNLLRAISQKRKETEKNKMTDGRPLLAKLQTCSLGKKAPASPLHHLSESGTQSPAVAKKDKKTTPPLSPLQPLSISGTDQVSEGYTIFSDCKYAVDACTTFASATDVYWVEARQAQAAISIIKGRGVQLEVDWIPGHCDHPLGDLADTTAKAHSSNALEPSLASTVTSTPLQVVKDFIKARARAWIVPPWWTNLHHKHPQRLFTFQQDALVKPPILKHITTAKRRTQASIVRLLLGQANNNNHMYHCGLRSSQACSLCPFPKDSTNHRLLHCPAYDEHRSVWKAELRSLGLPLTILVAIGLRGVQPAHHSAVASILIKFLDTTDLPRLFIWDTTAHQAPDETSTPSTTTLPAQARSTRTTSVQTLLYQHPQFHHLAHLGTLSKANIAKLEQACSGDCWGAGLHGDRPVPKSCLLGSSRESGCQGTVAQQACSQWNVRR